MAGYNRIILMGNLTRDPEYKQLGSGQAVCRLGLASNRQFRNKQSGDMVQEVCYIDVDVWGAQAESCKQYLAKGRPVLVEGRIKLDTWQDTDNKTRSKHSIVAERVVFLSAAGEASESAQTMTGADTGVLEPRNEVERELMSQLDEIKNRKKEPAAFGAASTTRRTAPKTTTGTTSSDTNGDVLGGFKDEAPFVDDLPF
jgi:single-strand DNA-binding protein